MKSYNIYIDKINNYKQQGFNYNKIKKDFYSSREASLFKLKKIDNEFSLVIGRLDKWKDLKREKSVVLAW